MTIPNAEHLLQQADTLIGPGGPGAPRQVNIRRAISNAYYGLFHASLTAAADYFVGRSRRTTNEYGLAYRSISHRWLRDLSTEVMKPTLAQRYRRYAPTGGFGPGLKAFAAAVVELQERRHSADYDPLIRLKRSDAAFAINTARAALASFEGAARAGRPAFLALLLFPPR